MRRDLTQMWDRSSVNKTSFKDPGEVKRLDQDVLSSSYFLSRIRRKIFELKSSSGAAPDVQTFHQLVKSKSQMSNRIDEVD